MHACHTNNLDLTERKDNRVVECRCEVRHGRTATVHSENAEEAAVFAAVSAALCFGSSREAVCT